MMRRVTTWVLLVLAGLLMALALYLIRPADVYEMLVGFMAGTLGTLQWLLLGIIAVLLSVVFVLDRPPTKGRRGTAITIAAVAIVLAGAVIFRDQTKFSRETVSVTAGAVQLEGTRYQPRNATNDKRPAILILHGSGSNKRGAYHGFARRFAERGFVVLNMDKQGVGGSTGQYYGDDLSTGVIERRADEGRAALAYLAGRPDVDTARIGVFSMSQGGWIVPLLLDGNSPARYGILFSGVAVSSGEESAWSAWSGEDTDHFGFKPPLIPFDEMDRRIAAVTPSAFNPRPALIHMIMPTLWMFGEWDSSAPTAASLRVLDTLRQAHLPIETQVLPEANHGLMVVRGPNGKRNADFPDALWKTVFDWAAHRHITVRALE